MKVEEVHTKKFKQLEDINAPKAKYIAYLTDLGVSPEDANDIYLAWVGV